MSVSTTIKVAFYSGGLIRDHCSAHGRRPADGAIEGGTANFAAAAAATATAATAAAAAAATAAATATAAAAAATVAAAAAAAAAAAVVSVADAAGQSDHPPITPRTANTVFSSLQVEAQPPPSNSLVISYNPGGQFSDSS